MTGFKDGASEDPFSSDAGETEPQNGTIQTSGPEMEGGSKPSQVQESNSTEQSTGLPWIYQRSSITSDRTTKQLHLQDETMRQETELQGELEAELGESVKKADVREAAYLVGMTHVGEIAEQLREWGYDFE